MWKRVSAPPFVGFPCNRTAKRLSQCSAIFSLALAHSGVLCLSCKAQAGVAPGFLGRCKGPECCIVPILELVLHNSLELSFLVTGGTGSDPSRKVHPALNRHNVQVCSLIGLHLWKCTSILACLPFTPPPIISVRLYVLWGQIILFTLYKCIIISGTL